MLHFQAVADAYHALIDDYDTRNALQSGTPPELTRAMAQVLLGSQGAVWVGGILAALSALASLLLAQRVSRRQWLVTAALVALVVSACVLWLHWRYEEAVRWS
jgi:hypothetical protein